MLDCISGGRVVAGMPLGSPMDANLCYGIPPIEQRERYYEAHDLILRAWEAREPFPFNGKYTQLPMVNIWPRPVQQPRPPVWVPGSGSLSTWDFAAEHDHCYCFLSYYGSALAKNVMDGFWEFVDNRGLEANPYRAGFLQLVAVSETDAQAEQDYYEHIRYFYDKCMHIAPEFAAPPGHQDYKSLVNTVKKQFAATGDVRSKLPEWKFKDFVENRFVIAGGPATVRDMLTEAMQDLRVGNLMVLLHIGSMTHELTLKNIDIFSREVYPHVRDMWDDKWENRWWPESLRHKRALRQEPAGVAGGGAA
jgi:alkanesulfonate monooxygenase SsuD/methylene tetrahydromethanopterin reductase-like flavin-dependent oxidoreductase (luciferase family)